jgi:hypothetical protein
MNNTSTWIWFILFVHHRSKRDDRPTEANWSEWRDALLEPLRELQGRNARAGDSTETGIGIWGITQRIWRFISEQPVLTLGSIHLSLMAAVGIWLWSNPSKFGQALDPSCDPTLTVIGVPARFSSVPLRIVSLTMYSIVLIPGLNLIPPFAFFLTLHISYNWSREQHQSFWKLCAKALWSILNVFGISKTSESSCECHNCITRVTTLRLNYLPFQRSLGPHQIEKKETLLNAPPQVIFITMVTSLQRTHLSFQRFPIPSPARPFSSLA